MEYIFHEKQQGQLCAQHCLNALLQEERFTAVDLADLARSLDAQERRCLIDGGATAEDLNRFLAEPSSGNVDDSGYFSIQVIERALDFCGLELVPYASPNNPVAIAARDRPMDAQAFICNYHNHWYTLRKLGFQWFNLNSTLSGPELLSDTYLTIFLEQVRAEGHSVFVVVGPLPACLADGMLKLNPAMPRAKPGLGRSGSGTSGLKSGVAAVVDVDDDDDADLKAALALSLQSDVDLESERQLQIALNRSRAAASPSTMAASSGGSHIVAAGPGSTSSVFAGHQERRAEEIDAKQQLGPAADEVRRLRSSFLDRFGPGPPTNLVCQSTPPCADVDQSLSSTGLEKGDES